VIHILSMREYLLQHLSILVDGGGKKKGHVGGGGKKPARRPALRNVGRPAHSFVQRRKGKRKTGGARPSSVPDRALFRWRKGEGSGGKESRRLKLV